MTTRLTIQQLDKLKPLTKDEITQGAIAELTARGYRVRKVFNGSAYKKRRNQVQKGVADIGGYTDKGLAVECEVKTLTDRFSDEQKERLNDLDKCGGLALVAVQKGMTVKIFTWQDYKTMIDELKK